MKKILIITTYARFIAINFIQKLLKKYVIITIKKILNYHSIKLKKFRLLFTS